jgi:hypothetical protein
VSGDNGAPHFVQKLATLISFSFLADRNSSFRLPDSSQYIAPPPARGDFPVAGTISIPMQED